MRKIITKTMGSRYYNSLPDDKEYAYYNPDKAKYMEVFISYNRVGYIGYLFEEGRYWAIIYIEEKYRNKNLLETMCEILINKLQVKALYAKIEKDNIIAVKAAKKLFKKIDDYDKYHYIFKIR